MPEKRPSWTIWGLAGLLTLCLTAPVFGQSGGLIDLYGYQTGGAIGDDRTAAGRASARPTTPDLLPVNAYAPIDGALDPLEYIVGPNDQFTVSAGGLQPILATVPVSADGFLVLPGFGRIQVAGKTLDEVQNESVEKLQAVFKNVAVDIALSRPREFYVHVNGAVPQPGKYLAMPAARVEDVLKDAFPLNPELLPLANPRFRPALRNIVIRQRDGGETRVDLVRYYRTGDRSHNPMLGDGDAIFVPAFDPSHESVFIDGDVAFPGKFDFREGDTVIDVLSLGVGASLSRVDTVRLTRKMEDGSAKSWFLSVDDLLTGKSDPVVLQPMDNVHVPRNDWDSGFAIVEGAVRYPGSYPIRIGETTLKDLVAAAGGMLDVALERGAYIERGIMSKKPDFRDRDPSLIDPRSILPEMGIDTITTPHEVQLGNLDFFGMTFLARSLRLHRRVSVNVEESLQEGADPVYLQDEDRLIVPRDHNSVFVIGQVTRPGAVSYDAAFSAEDFVRSAGGTAAFAGNTYIVRAGTGEVAGAQGRSVGSGDIVYVNREGGDPYTLESKRLDLMRRDVRTRKFQLALQTVGTLLSVVTTVLLVDNALSN